MAVRSKRSDESSSSVREAIVSHATELFARKGYHGASVREIVEAAGITAPTLYYHFGSKEGLFRYIIRELMERLSQRVEQAREAGSDLREQLLFIARGHIQSLLTRPADTRFLHRVILGLMQHGEFKDELAAAPFPGNPLLQIFVEAQQRGELADAPLELLFNSFIGSLNMYVARRILHICAGEDALELGGFCKRMHEMGLVGVQAGAGANDAAAAGGGNNAEQGAMMLPIRIEDAETIVDLFLRGAERRAGRDEVSR